MATRAAKLALRGKALSDTGTEIGIVNNADATAITIDASENVGIGTSSPSDKLDIQGADNGLTIRSISANRPKITLINGSSTMLTLSANGTYAAIGDGTDANRYMSFKSGKVGIGTSAPSEKLSIAGGMNMNGYEITRVGRHRGTGVYTLFTNGSGSTQSSGTVEVHSIYGTPSTASRQLYLISGNRAITLIESNGTSTIRQPAVSWNGATLEVNNTNGSVYYIVKVILYEIGNSWAPTWGTLDGIANT